MYKKKDKVLIKRRGNSRYFIRFFIISSFLIFTSFLIYHQLGKMDYFNIKNIVIKGNRNVPTTYIYDFVKKNIGMNIFKCSEDYVKQELIGIVRINSIKIDRRLPSTLVINIVENKAKFILKTKDGYLIPISENNLILDNAEFYIDDNAPIIDVSTTFDKIKIGEIYQDSLFENIKNIHNKIAVLRNVVVNRISEYSMTEENILLFTLDNGVKVIPDTSKIENTLERLTFALMNSYAKKYQTIDLRFNNLGVIKSEEK